MKKQFLSLALALALCLGLTVPVSAKDWREASPDDASGTFTIMRNGTVDEKSGTYLSEKKAYILNPFLAEEETEIHYAAAAPTDTWVIGNTGSKALTASGNASYDINIWLGAYWPSDERKKADGETVYEGGFSNWWGDHGHFVDGILDSSADEHGCISVLVKPGETTAIPFSAFSRMTDGRTDCIYELTIRALYPGASKYEDSFEGMVEQCFYFKLDPDAKSAMDAKAEQEPAPAAGKFTDVTSDDYFSEPVKWAVEHNITSGTSKTAFSPGATCSRAQILTFLWRASGSPEPAAGNPFADIKSTDYYYKAALWAAEKGIVSGSAFGPSAPCTRASTMEYMWKAAGSPAASYDGKFDDVAANADYAQAVAWAVENKVTAGTSETTFGPGNTCTRGQIVTFLYRAFAE